MRTFPGVKACYPRLAAIAAIAIPLFSSCAMAAQDSRNNSPESAPAAALPTGEPETRSWQELRAALGNSDRVVALRALQIALNRVGDGGTFIWQRKSRGLKGIIRPTRAFRNAEGQVCRRLIYALVIGQYIKQIKGTACREEDGRWGL